MQSIGLIAVKLLRTGVTSLLILTSTPSVADNLLEIYQQALVNDPIFKAQQAELSAEIEVRNQANAQLYKPTVSLSANIDRNYQDITSVVAGGNSQFTGRGYSLNLSQPIYHRDRFIRLKQVDIQVAKAQLELDAARQNLMLRTAQRYFDALAAKDNLNFAAAEKHALERQLEQSTERFNVGLIAITDVHEAQAGFDLATAKELRAANTHEDTLEALREITGRYPGDLAGIASSIDQTLPEPNDINSWTVAALSNNLQLKATLLETEIIEKEITRQSSGHHPTVDIVGSHGFQSTGGQFGNTDIDFSKIGVEVNIPIYSGGQIKASTREAFHRHEAALENLEQTRRQTERQTRDAYRGVISGSSQLKAFKQAVLSSETAVTATRAGYEVGTRSAVDVVTAEQDFSRALRDYSQAKYEYILETLSLKQVSGILTPIDLESINSSLEQ